MFSSRKNLNRHLSNTVFTCPIDGCSQRNARGDRMKGHFIRVHPGATPPLQFPRTVIENRCRKLNNYRNEAGESEGSDGESREGDGEEQTAGGNRGRPQPGDCPPPAQANRDDPSEGLPESRSRRPSPRRSGSRGEDEVSEGGRQTTGGGGVGAQSDPPVVGEGVTVGIDGEAVFDPPVGGSSIGGSDKTVTGGHSEAAAARSEAGAPSGGKPGEKPSGEIGRPGAGAPSVGESGSSGRERPRGGPVPSSARFGLVAGGGQGLGVVAYLSPIHHSTPDRDQRPGEGDPRPATERLEPTPTGQKIEDAAAVEGRDNVAVEADSSVADVPVEPPTGDASVGTPTPAGDQGDAPGSSGAERASGELEVSSSSSGSGSSGSGEERSRQEDTPELSGRSRSRSPRRSPARGGSAGSRPRAVPGVHGGTTGPAS